MKSAPALCMLAALALISFVLPPSSVAADVAPRAEPQVAEPHIAVLREGAVWVWQPGERFAPVPHSEGADRASFSPDGRFLAVHKSSGELWLVALPGGRSWLVAKDRVTPDIAWAPTGSRLAYIRGHALWVVPCGPAGPVDWGMAAPEAERFAWSDDGNRLFVATSAWSPPPPVTPSALPAPSPPAPVRRHPVHILEVKWQGGPPVVWGELPPAMPSRIKGNRAEAGQKEPTGPPIWGVDGVYPAPGGRGVAVAVRDAPDGGKAHVRGLAGFTGRSAEPVWLSPPRPGPLLAAGWAEQNGRPWFAFLTSSKEGRGGSAAPRSVLFAWSPGGTGREAAGVVRVLTPKGAEDTFATPHTRRSGWIVSRSPEQTWRPHRFGPRAMWVVRPDGRAVRVSRPPFGKEDVAGWWGPDEQWLWLRVSGAGAQLWWWPRTSGEDGELCLDDIPPEAAKQPNMVQVQFVPAGMPEGKTTKER